MAHINEQRHVARGQRAACAKVGVVYRDVPIDGKWHPADIEGDKRGRGDARIIVFADGQGGYVHNWKENAGESFFADDGRQLNETERRERDRKRAEAMREAQKDAERQRAVETATKAEAIWKAASSDLARSSLLHAQAGAAGRDIARVTR